MPSNPDYKVVEMRCRRCHHEVKPAGVDVRAFMTTGLCDECAKDIVKAEEPEDEVPNV